MITSHEPCRTDQGSIQWQLSEARRNVRIAHAVPYDNTASLYNVFAAKVKCADVYARFFGDRVGAHALAEDLAE